MLLINASHSRLQCYMAPHEEEDDPAVYRAGSKKSKESSPSARTANEGGRASRSPSAKAPSEPMEADASDQSDDDDDGTLLTVQPGFNRLLLVLREGVVEELGLVEVLLELRATDTSFHPLNLLTVSMEYNINLLIVCRREIAYSTNPPLSGWTGLKCSFLFGQ